MKVKVLGCSGSETIGHLPPGFLVNDRVMLDAGTISAALSIAGQSRITDIFISHTHLDHIKGILFLADNIIGRVKQPVNIRAIPKVIDAIRKPTAGTGWFMGIALTFRPSRSMVLPAGKGL